MVIAVIDGMGGRIGAQIVAQCRQVLGDGQEILALGTNGVATQKMVKAGASRGATGDNAICFSVAQADLVVAPMGVVIPNAMMGEISPQVATAVASAPARKFLIPINQPYFEIVGVSTDSLSNRIEEAVELVRQAIQPACS